MMMEKSNLNPILSTSPINRESDIAGELERLRQDIKADKAGLDELDTPLGEMRYRAEKAEKSLRASDLALRALQALQRNSLEINRATDAAILALKATIKENDEHSHHKDQVLEGLNKIIEKNRQTIEASAIAFRALNEMAFHDPLTGLPNRRLLSDRLKQAIINNKRWDSYSAVIFMDLDKFKRLNDDYGHEAGDELLIAVGNRLKQSVREVDTVARYGGDEFVVLLGKLNGNLVDARQEAEEVAKKILNSLIPPYAIHIHNPEGKSKAIEYQNFASLGVAMFGGDLTQEASILDWADEAMYWAKSEGGKGIRFYDQVNSVEQTLMYLYDLATQNDIETSNHGIRTRQYVKTLANRAKQMNVYPDQLSNEIIERLFKTTQLHDIGKTKIPYAIIHKNGKLTDEEWVVMKTHTTLGAEILEQAKKQNSSLTDFLNTAIDIAVAHHERWDGSGYPRGLAGVAIPLAGRIMAVADIYDALISRRSYKEPWSHEDAVAEILSKSGTQLDPLLIEVFIREQENFRLIAENAKD